MIRIFKKLFRKNRNDYETRQMEEQFKKIEGIKSDYQATNIHRQCPCIR